MLPNHASPSNSGPSPPAGEEDVGAAADETAASTTSEATEDGPGEMTPDELVRKILELDGRIARNEGEAVAMAIEKGQTLIRLKSQAKRAWGKRLEQLKLSPRVASRLQAIGAWGREIGPVGSDLIGKLPHDRHKLEWLAKLDREQLQRLVAEIDCREEPRPKVIGAVKEFLGQVKP